jgi:thiol-disulfide isomerase/thioredoxin
VTAQCSAVKDKFDAGKTTQADLDENIKAIAQLILQHQADPDRLQLSRLYLLDAHIYADGLKDTAKARSIWNWVAKCFPGTQAAQFASYSLAQLDAGELPESTAPLPLFILPMLKTGTQVYSNVVITRTTRTNISFTHAHGSAVADVKNLAPALRQQLAAKLSSPGRPPSRNDGSEIQVPQIWARSVLNQPAPPFAVEKWVTPAPNTIGKFVLLEFWATSCPVCKAEISKINDLAARYRDRLVVIGISPESESEVRKMKSPQIDYSLAIDPQKRMKDDLGITGIPHAILIDPNGVVRFEGMPHFLWVQVGANGRAIYTGSGLERLLVKYPQ